MATICDASLDRFYLSRLDLSPLELFIFFLQNDISFVFLLEFFEHAFLEKKRHLPPQKLSNCLDFNRF